MLTCKCAIRIVRALVLFLLSLSLLGMSLCAIAQEDSGVKSQLQIEHRFTELESEYSNLVSDVKDLKDDVKQIKYYGVAMLVGMAAVLGETGLRITGIKLFKKED